jgi:hypothetical protein
LDESKVTRRKNEGKQAVERKTDTANKPERTGKVNLEN